MNAGTGMIRFHAAAEFPAVAPGRHELLYRNTHQPDISVYLSNALVPVDRQIEINAQRRDTSQAELAIEYRVVAKSAWPVSWFLPAAFYFSLWAGKEHCGESRVLIEPRSGDRS